MEKRAILAAVLMAALLMVYQAYFVPVPKETPPPPAEQPPKTAPAIPPATLPPIERERRAAVPTTAPSPAEARPLATPRPTPRAVSVESPLYRAVVTSDGGKLQEWTLRYRGEKPLVIVAEQGPTGLLVARGPGVAAEPLPMHLGPEPLSLGPGRPRGEVRLNGDEDALRVTESLEFSADSYAVDAMVRVENTGRTPQTVTIALPWFTRIQKGAPEKFIGQHPTEIVWGSDGHVERIDDLTKAGTRPVEGQWIGLDSTWYLTALIPKTAGFQLAVMSDKGGGGDKNGAAARTIVAVRATPTIAPGQAWEGRVTLYAGPKEYDRLQAFGLEGTLNFGGFPVPRKYGGLPMEWLGVPILKLMNFVYRYVGNYGIAIILLTVISKLLFYPLTMKGMRSMKAMQALQPQINSLRSKYKSDPQRLQRETLELYRKHKVNPMGGCLPMVAQVPIFYALYLALSVSVELQNAPFLCFGRFFGVDLWVCDLASHDPTYVLPILMGISMFAQQKMTPTMGDPRQAKAMLVMPFVFTFMFLNLPSGLVLYWFVSNVLQILQQWFMDRHKTRGSAREAKDAARA